MIRIRNCRDEPAGWPTRRSIMVGVSAFAVLQAAPSGPASARQCGLTLAPGGWLLRTDDPVSRPTA